MSLKRYLVVCEHHGRIRTFVYYESIALCEQDAITKFMNWHEREYPHRRAYNVECAAIEIVPAW